MTGLAFVLVDALLLVVSWAIVVPLAREHDDRHQADNDGQANMATAAPRAALAGVAPRPPAWYGVTLPPAAPAVRLSAPRVSGGRVSLANWIRYQYALADQPACQVLAAYGWPAQEVTA